MPRARRIPRELSIGPFSGTRAVAAGLLTRRMLAGRTWRRVLPDVYVPAAVFDADDHRMWCEAVALKLPPGGAVRGLSAAYLWGVDLLPRDSPVHVDLPPTTRLWRHPRVAVTHHALEPADITTLFGGIPLTTEVRTGFDLGRGLPRADALAALDALLRHRSFRREALVRYLDAHPGRRGTAQLRELVALAEPLSESPMESRLRLLLHDAGLPRPVPQHEVRTLPHASATSATLAASATSATLGAPPSAVRHGTRGRFLARVDLAYPQWRIAIEYEGDHHRERTTFRRDVARYNALRAAGWLVLRFTADDVLRQSGQVVRDVRQAIAERATS